MKHVVKSKVKFLRRILSQHDEPEQKYPHTDTSFAPGFNPPEDTKKN